MVQAVLLTVMVMTIGLLAVISRVTSSRDASSASSLQAAAKQAAEFGFSEVVAEMNRNGNSYLWITPFSNWSSVSQADLQACAMYSPPVLSANPIEGVSSSRSLPDSNELSYRLTEFIPPVSVGSSGCGVFSNRKGGSALLTIEGRAQRGSGNVTTHTLRRSVSVGPAISPFQQSLLGDPGAVAAVSDPRFPPFPTVPAPSSLPDPGPALDCSAGSGTSFSCTAGTDTYSFDNASQQKFPYPYVIPAVASTSSPPPFCEDNGTEINCRFASLRVGSGTDNLNLIVTALSATSSSTAKPVNLFIDGTLTVDDGAKLCSHASAGASATSVTTCAAASGDWQQLRIYGRAPGGTCPSQAVELNAMTAPTTDAGRPNLQGAFLWFPVGSLSVSGTITASQADLRGWVCARPTVIVAAAWQRIWPDRIFSARIFRGYGSRELAR
ncbi:MAG: hypothetical protein ACKO8I_17265 [Cyanobacteriota bacterium]